MIHSTHAFKKGVKVFGGNLVSLLSAYSCATSLGSLTSVSGLFAGAIGIILGGFVGYMAGTIAFSAAVELILYTLCIVNQLIFTAVDGVCMMFASRNPLSL